MEGYSVVDSFPRVITRVRDQAEKIVACVGRGLHGHLGCVFEGALANGSAIGRSIVAKSGRVIRADHRATYARSVPFDGTHTSYGHGIPFGQSD